MIGFLFFHYAFLPEIPEEDPVKIAVTFSSCVEADTHTITQPDDISKIMKALRAVEFHRQAYHVSYDGGVSFSPIRLEYSDGTVLLYNGAGASQFYLRYEDAKSMTQLYKMNQDDYNHFFNTVSETCSNLK